mmetsp:Transcript_7989/g.22816  ORF Transcript_7989/g.22816 Transcript_7989/m.22816 type:complete len:213 (+) Transcript_7989:130-768(+)
MTKTLRWRMEKTKTGPIRVNEVDAEPQTATRATAATVLANLPCIPDAVFEGILSTLAGIPYIPDPAIVSGEIQSIRGAASGVEWMMLRRSSRDNLCKVSVLLSNHYHEKFNSWMKTKMLPCLEIPTEAPTMMLGASAVGQLPVEPPDVLWSVAPKLEAATLGWDAVQPPRLVLPLRQPDVVLVDLWCRRKSMSPATNSKMKHTPMYLRILSS